LAQAIIWVINFFKAWFTEEGQAPEDVTYGQVLRQLFEVGSLRKNPFGLDPASWVGPKALAKLHNQGMTMFKDFYKFFYRRADLWALWKHKYKVSHEMMQGLRKLNILPWWGMPTVSAVLQAEKEVLEKTPDLPRVFGTHNGVMVDIVQLHNVLVHKLVATYPEFIAIPDPNKRVGVFRCVAKFSLDACMHKAGTKYTWGFMNVWPLHPDPDKYVSDMPEEALTRLATSSYMNFISWFCGWKWADISFLMQANLADKVDHSLLDNTKLCDLLQKSNVQVLSDMASARGLPTKGTKALLQQRILAFEMGMATKTGHADLLGALGWGSDNDSGELYEPDCDSVSQSGSGSGSEETETDESTTESEPETAGVQRRAGPVGSTQSQDQQAGSSSQASRAPPRAPIQPSGRATARTPASAAVPTRASARVKALPKTGKGRVTYKESSDSSQDAAKEQDNCQHLLHELQELQRDVTYEVRQNKTTGKMEYRDGPDGEWQQIYDDEQEVVDERWRKMLTPHTRVKPKQAERHLWGDDTVLPQMKPARLHYGDSPSSAESMQRPAEPPRREESRTAAERNKQLMNFDNACRSRLLDHQRTHPDDDTLESVSREHGTTFVQLVEQIRNSRVEISTSQSFKELSQLCTQASKGVNLPSQDRVSQAQKAGPVQYESTCFTGKGRGPGWKPPQKPSPQQPVHDSDGELEQEGEARSEKCSCHNLASCPCKVLESVDKINVETLCVFCLDLKAQWEATREHPVRSCTRFKPAQGNQPERPHKCHSVCILCNLPACQKGQVFKVVRLGDLVKELEGIEDYQREQLKHPERQAPQEGGPLPRKLTPQIIADALGMEASMLLRINKYVSMIDSDAKEECRCFQEQTQIAKLADPCLQWRLDNCDELMPDNEGESEDDGEGAGGPAAPPKTSTKATKTLKECTFIPHSVYSHVRNKCDNKYHLQERAFRDMTYWNSAPLTPDIARRYLQMREGDLMNSTDLLSIPDWQDALIRVKLALPEVTHFPNSVLKANDDDLDSVIRYVICILHALMAIVRSMLNLVQVSLVLYCVPCRPGLPLLRSPSSDRTDIDPTRSSSCCRVGIPPRLMNSTFDSRSGASASRPRLPTLTCTRPLQSRGMLPGISWRRWLGASRPLTDYPLWGLYTQLLPTGSWRGWTPPRPPWPCGTPPTLCSRWPGRLAGPRLSRSGSSQGSATQPWWPTVGGRRGSGPLVTTPT
jgi:hypothetical protein